MPCLHAHPQGEVQLYLVRLNTSGHPVAVLQEGFASKVFSRRSPSPSALAVGL